jgi:hypothetical protein
MTSARAATLVLVLAAGGAGAHIKLEEPPSFQVTNALGDPQKLEPCGGAGTPTGVVTTVEAGSTLTVRWTETIGHPGHFRIGIATDVSHFVTPPAVVMNNDCKSATIETTPAYPTLVDGLFPHSNAPSGLVRTANVTVPDLACERCTLQLLQFMSAHTPPCFYFQCATLRIVRPDAGVPAPDAGADAGAVDAGGSAETRPDGGAALDAGPLIDAGVDVPDAGHSHGEPAQGCGCGGLGPPTLLVLLAAARRRRG